MWKYTWSSSITRYKSVDKDLILSLVLGNIGESTRALITQKGKCMCNMAFDDDDDDDDEWFPTVTMEKDAQKNPEHSWETKIVK